jgi:hypothetical protein
MSSYFDNGGFIGVSAPFGTKFSRIIENGLQLWLDASNPQSYGPENFVPYSVDITPSTSPDWISFNSLSTTATTGVDGQNDAFTLTDSDSTNYAGVYITNDNPSVYETVQTMTAICHVKKNAGGPWAIVGVYFQDTPSFTNGTNYRVYLNPDNGDFIAQNALNAEVTSQGNWWRIMFEVQTQGTGYDRMVYDLYPAEAPAGPTHVGNPTTTGSNTFWNPQLQRGPKSNYRRPVKTTGSVIKREERWWGIGDSLNATLNGTSFTSDAGGGIVFGNGNTGSIPSGLTFSGTGTGYTISVWLKHTGAVNTARVQRYFTLAPEAATLRHSTATNSNLHAYSVDSGGTIRQINIDNQIFTNQYYNLVSVYDGNSITLYKNGVNVGNVVTSFTLGTPSDAVLSSAAEYFEGNMYSVQYYNRPLSTSEIGQNYNALRGRFGL